MVGVVVVVVAVATERMFKFRICFSLVLLNSDTKVCVISDLQLLLFLLTLVTIIYPLQRVSKI